MAGPVDRDRLLARERRLMIPVGWITLLGVALFVLAVFLRTGAGEAPSAGEDAERLTQVHEHGGRLLLGSVFGGLAFLCFAAPLYLLFIGARARSERVRSAFVAFAFIGPVLLAIQGPVQSVAFQDIADTFAEERPALEAQAEADSATEPAENPPEQADKPASEAPPPAEEKAADAKPEGSGGEVTTAPTEQEPGTGTTDSEDESSDDEDEDDPVEQRAEDLISDSSAAQFAGSLAYPAILGLLIGMVYISLWAMRTGLLTRFYGSLGMALGVSLALLGPFAQLLIVLWFVTVAMMLLGRWPGGRPPAWDAGVAMPWLRPGERPPAPGDPVEGSGREVPPDAPGEDGEPPEGTNGTAPAGDSSDPRSGGDPGSGGAQPPPGPTQPPRRKRKRRDYPR